MRERKQNSFIFSIMNNKSIKTMLVAACSFALLPAMAQSFQFKTETLSNPDNAPAPCHPVPTDRQVLWNETEFYAFFHYGMNTYTGEEWGNGDESESLFAPTAAPNPRQWLEAAKSAGMKGGIAVVKHHDGFCLWPTATTTHNCTNGGNANGKNTNIPRDFAAAAKDLGLKYGFYVSPWDRNSAKYGTDDYVTDVFLKQCAELAEYGDDQFEMWFDGANGGKGYYGGKNTTITVDQSIYYDVPNLRAKVHQICPNCVLWGVGGEARWIGNEAGWAGETCWSPMDRGGSGNNQYGQEDGWMWLPGESDAKATSGGWFWKSYESVSSAERLFQMYLETVGRNATLILNLPPDKSGSLPTATVNRLKEFGTMRTNRLSNDLAKSATIEVSDTRTGGKYDAANMTDGDKDTYWGTNDATREATITLTWDSPKTIRYVQMMEPIRLGQRIKSFKIEYSANGTSWTPLASSVETTTVGYKRIVPLNGSTSNSYGSGYSAKKLRITIEGSRACPLLSNLSVF